MASKLFMCVGDKVLIRTVTMIQVGKIRALDKDFIVLSDASWIADTGRFGEALAKGTLNEIEKCGEWLAVSRGSIVDIHPWIHDLPAASK